MTEHCRLSVLPFHMRNFLRDSQHKVRNDYLNIAYSTLRTKYALHINYSDLLAT